VIYYIDYTTTLAISSARMLWTRIILGGLYVVIAGFIARIVLEIVLALFVVKVKRDDSKDTEKIIKCTQF
jgi:hypothetical protein